MDVRQSNEKWNTETMRDYVDKWSLSNDIALLKYLESFSQNILSKAQCTLHSLNDFEMSLLEACVDIRTASNRFQALADIQFVENRVYEEEDIPLVAEEDSSLQHKEEISKKKLKEGILSCFHLLDYKFEAIQLSGSDSEDEGFGNQSVLRPVNHYMDRPLPHLIGSEEFMNDDTLGLLQQSSDDSENEIESEMGSSDDGNSKSFNDDNVGANLVAISSKLEKTKASSSSSLSSEYEQSGENYSKFLRTENVTNANSLCGISFDKNAETNISNDHGLKQEQNISDILFDSESNESTESSYFNYDKEQQGSNLIFDQNVNLFDEKPNQHSKLKDEDFGSEDKIQHEKKKPDSTIEKISEGSPSKDLCKDNNLFIENLQSVLKNKIQEKKKENQNPIIKSKPSIFETRKEPTPKSSRDDYSVENRKFAIDEKKKDILSPFIHAYMGKDVFEDSDNEDTNQNLFKPNETVSDSLEDKVDLFAEDDTDLFRNLNLPNVSHPELSLFSDNVFLFKEESALSFLPKEQEKSQQRNAHDTIKKKITKPPVNYILNENHEKTSETAKANIKSFSQNFIREIVCDEYLEKFDSKNVKKMNLNLKSPETLYSKEEKTSFNKTSDNLAKSKLAKEKDLSFTGKTSTENNFDFLAKKNEIFSECVLPPITTTTLDCLVKDRARIQIKRRPPSRKIKDSVADKSKEISKPLTILSPSTDEEDIFIIPFSDLQNDKSTSNLFSGKTLLSPGISIDEDCKVSNEGLQKPLNYDNSNFEEVFKDEDTNEQKSVYSVDLFASLKDNEILPEAKGCDIFSEETGSKIFETNYDLFPNLNNQGLTKESQNNKILSHDDRIDGSAIHISNSELANKEYKPLFQDSSDDEDNLFSFLTNKSSHPITGRSNGDAGNKNQGLPVSSRRPNQLEKKEVLSDPLMALNSTLLSE